LTAIAGSIGAALFVAIGSGVMSGPLCLLIAFVFWASVVFSVAQCQTEIVTLLPLDGSFIRLAGRMVDPALGVAVGWNHFFAQTSYVIFEATIINTLVEYWGYDQSPAILITVSLLFYLAINVYRADLFGEAEFWLALGKVLLATGLIMYTFCAMLGANPIKDRFGFRHWRDPGVWAGDDSSKRLMSFINAVNVAGFCMGGPEYISMIAGEARDPRRTVPRAFKTIVTRLIVFFIGGALSVGILVPYNDKTLTNGSGSYAGGSPYVISMERLKIPILPSIVNAALITTIISAGNAYTFNASRSLHALAVEGQAPKILRRLNRHGTPYMAVVVVMTLSCLAYLALGSSSAKVLNWILNFCTAATMFNWSVMALTWIRFNAAMKAQGFDRKQFLPSISRFQPFAGWWALFWAFLFLW
jgi:amino acid transporter